MNAARHGSITRTFMVIVGSVSVFVAGCGSDNNSSGPTEVPTTTATNTASSTGTSPLGTTEPQPFCPKAPTETATSPTVQAVDEGFTPELQNHLDAINADCDFVVVAKEICTTIDKQTVVPVLAMRNQLLVSAEDQDPNTASQALNNFLGSLASPPTVSTVASYSDNVDRPAAGLFLATLDTVTFDNGFMQKLQAFNAHPAPPGTLISLNLVYSMSQVWRFHPYGSPVGVPDAPSDGGSGGGDRTIAVFDSLYPDTFPAITNVPSPGTPADGKTVPYPSNPPGVALSAYGHGPFVSMLIQRFAPAATIRAWGIAQSIDGDGVFITVADVQAAMSSAFGERPNPDGADFEGVPPDVINLSFGGPGCELAETAVFGNFLKRLTTQGEWSGDSKAVPVIVAAAGNSSAQVLEYPAAFPNVVAVGSMTTGNVPDCFSNVGDWMDIWAPGADQVSYYPYDSGWAKWSGTSFAAARVSAMLATSNGSPSVASLDVWQQVHGNPPAGFEVQQVTTPTQCP